MTDFFPPGTHLAAMIGCIAFACFGLLKVLLATETHQAIMGAAIFLIGLVLLAVLMFVVPAFG